MIEDSAGFYEVCGIKYYNKLDAYRTALKQGYWPHWNFHDEFFKNQDWTLEPEESLNELYCQRAKQIREKYDHVIIWFSGGADSDNVVRSFLHNNIHIDEIWHRSSWERIARTDTGTDSFNQANETRHTAIPLLKEYEMLAPGTSIRIFDAMDLSIDLWSKESADPFETNYFNPLSMAKHQSHRFNTAKTKSGTIVKLAGVDKPRLHYRDGKFYFYFFDNVINTHIMHNRLNSLSRENDECFYWHPTAFKLVLKQAHLVKKYFEQHPNLLWLLELKSFDAETTKFYNNIIKQIIYPHWNIDNFQTLKASSDIDHEEFFWFYQNQSSTAFQNWFKTANAYSHEVVDIYKNLPKEQHNYRTVGLFNSLPGNYSNFYPLTH